MEEHKTIKIATDFSSWGAGRYRSQGKWSAEVLREDHLAPALRGAKVVEVNLDGMMGMGASFLEEAFGGLVRECGFTGDESGESPDAAGWFEVRPRGHQDVHQRSR